MNTARQTWYFHSTNYCCCTVDYNQVPGTRYTIYAGIKVVLVAAMARVYTGSCVSAGPHEELVSLVRSTQRRKRIDFLLILPNTPPPPLSLTSHPRTTQARR